jgi:tetratricopeptide (TPR) repeat protein
MVTHLRAAARSPVLDGQAPRISPVSFSPSETARHFPGVASIAFVILLMLASLLSTPAYGSVTEDIAALVKAGKLQEAQRRIDASLAEHPQDAQLLFMKGLVLADMGMDASAINVFFELTVLYPELAEPYNNLAVLYARIGKLEEARKALEMAVRLSPEYATASQNLAILSYRSTDNGGNAVDDAIPVPGTVTASDTATDAAVKTGSVDQKRLVVLERSRDPAPQGAMHAEKPQAEGEPAPLTDVEQQRARVLSTLNDWANAWSARDVTSYLTFYSTYFKPPGKQSRRRWELGRRRNIVSKASIRITISDPSVHVEKPYARVRFRQLYTSDKLVSDDIKTLVFLEEPEGWKIVEEFTEK